MITAAYSVGAAIGIEGSPPDGWTEIFKTGGTPSDDRSLFPSKAELLAELEKVHEIWKATLPTVASSVLDAEQPNENMRASFPTVGALIAFIMTSHEMDHLGQIAAWRRGAGLGLGFRLPDIVQMALCFGLHGLRHCVQHVSGFVDPAALLAGIAKRFT